MWDELDIPLDKAFAQMDYALLVGGPEAATAAGEARTFFELAGNRHMLERLAGVSV
jgi:hypothetical protein